MQGAYGRGYRQLGDSRVRAVRFLLGKLPRLRSIEPDLGRHNAGIEFDGHDVARAIERGGCERPNGLSIYVLPP